MNKTLKNLTLLVLSGVVLATAGCVEGDLDNPNSAEVYLEVVLTESPPVRCQTQAGANLITVEEWSASYANVPKNSLAETSPFNDIEIISVTINYDFPDINPAVWPPEREIPSPGTIIPDEEQQLTFEPILFQDLDVGLLGTSGILQMTIKWTTPSDTKVYTKRVGEVLMIESCSGG
jgi:hypothetical protein